MGPHIANHASIFYANNTATRIIMTMWLMNVYSLVLSVECVCAIAILYVREIKQLNKAHS